MFLHQNAKKEKEEEEKKDLIYSSFTIALKQVQYFLT